MARRVAGENQVVPERPVRALLRFYEQMVMMRRFEESLLELFAAGRIDGTVHTYIGQEANAVGVIDHLEPARDVIVSNHRCHGHYLAFTDDAVGLLREVMGREGGVCGGKGGSQHLCNGNFYSNGVLGSTVPVATGMALAEKQRRTGAVTVAFLGDGTLGQGVVYESLNLASLWDLPILFVVENNFYAQSTPSRLNLAGRIADRGAAFGIETAELSTTDVLEINDVAGEIVPTVRAGGRPFFLVLNTYRFSAHSKGDDDRDEAEIETARERDPLLVAGMQLADEERRAIDEACEQRLADVIDAAESSPPVVPSE